MCVCFFCVGEDQFLRYEFGEVAYFGSWQKIYYQGSAKAKMVHILISCPNK
jgi:hypothetical protein